MKMKEVSEKRRVKQKTNQLSAICFHNEASSATKNICPTFVVVVAQTAHLSHTQFRTQISATEKRNCVRTGQCDKHTKWW